MESDERLLLPPAGSGRDAGAGARLRAGDRDRRARHGEGRRARCRREIRRSGRAHLVLRQCRHALRHRNLQDARLHRTVGRDHAPSATACTDAKQRRFRYGVQVNSLGLTEQQPENNVYRILIEMLAVTLSKDARARAVQLPAWNEALGLPRPWDQQWSLRMQQILAYETDLLEYGDIFDGSTEIARKVAELKEAAKDELKRIEEMGGAVAAVEIGYMKQQLVESNTARLEAIERGEQIVVGVNKFIESEPSPLADAGEAILTVSEEAEREQIEQLKAWRAARDEAAVKAALADAERAAPAAATSCRPRSTAPRPASPPANGADAARGLRRIPRADRRRPRHAQRRHRPGRHPRRGRSRVAQARPAHEVPGRQARPRRPFQRRRADRGARARRRHGGGLRGIRLTPEEIVDAARKRRRT